MYIMSLSTPLNFTGKCLDLGIAICSLYFHFVVWWSINFCTSCDDTMFKALYNWFYPDTMITHLRKSSYLVTVGGVCNSRKRSLSFCHHLTTAFHVFSQKIYLIFWDVLHNLCFFSTKCFLFYKVSFFFPLKIFIFYMKGAQKFKCLSSPL